MKSFVRMSVVVAVVGLSFGLASDADARCCFLQKLFNRGGCCHETTCCEPDPCGCESTPDCGCGCAAAPSDCGCGGTVVQEGVVVEGSAEPTEASPSDMQNVPEPPPAEDAPAPEGDVKPADVPADAAT